MATYVYETIPQKPGDPPRRFEVRQSMNDAPLALDPETGLPVKRIILGGYGIISKGSGSKTAEAMGGEGGCDPSGGECEAGACEMPAGPAGHVCASPFCCRN